MINLIKERIDADVITKDFTGLKKLLKTKGVDMTADEKEWEEDVVEPVRELIEDLATLSKGWAQGALVVTLVSASMVCALVCWAVSPTLGPWAEEQSGLPWLGAALSIACGFGAVGFSAMPLMLLTAPARVSTQCDDVRTHKLVRRAVSFSSRASTVS